MPSYPVKTLKCISGNDVVEEGVDEELLSEAENAWAQREWSIQHVLFPSMRLFFKPPTSMATNGTFVQVCMNMNLPCILFFQLIYLAFLVPTCFTVS